MWRNKDGKAQREDNVATRLPSYKNVKNLTHTSKTRQVKRTQLVATTKFTIRVFVTYSNW